MPVTGTLMRARSPKRIYKIMAKVIGFTVVYSSKPDKYGNSRHAFEFVDTATGRTTNVSGGAVVTAGITFYF